MAPGKREEQALIWRWQANGAERADRAIVRALEEGEGVWEPSKPDSLPSRSQIQKLIEEGRVLSDGAPIRSSAKLTLGQVVELSLPPARPLELIPEDLPIEIIFQDEHLVVVNKPPGLTVHPSETQADGTLVHALLHHVKDLSGIGGVLRPGIVHRIDKDTSGALVVTKTDAAHRVLVETFAKHEIERRYWAICFGSPKLRNQEEKKIESLIARSPNDRKRMSMQVEEGRKAITYIRELETYSDGSKTAFASLVEARLETGRTHQVRVHLTGLGHSLLGDPVYGTPSDRHTKWVALPANVRKAAEALPGQALHARTLGFKHPITGKDLRFEAEAPKEFAAVLAALEPYRSRK